MGKQTLGRRALLALACGFVVMIGFRLGLAAGSVLCDAGFGFMPVNFCRTVAALNYSNGQE
jgi:hypothetical protein